MREPARRSIGCESSAIVGCGRSDSSAMTCRDGLIAVRGGSGTSKTSTMSFGGNAYRGGSDALGTCAASAGVNKMANVARRANRRLNIGRSFRRLHEAVGLLRLEHQPPRQLRDPRRLNVLAV